MRHLSFLAILFLTAGCLKTRSEVSETTDRKTNQQQISSMQQAKADQEVRLNEMESNFRQLNGRLEALEHRLNVDVENRQRMAGGQEMTQKQMLEQMKLFEDSITRMEQKLAAMETARSAEPAKSSNVIAVPAPGGKNAKQEDPPSYREAEGLFNQKEWKKAILSYQAYRDENPKGDKFPDATYKIGVCFQELGKKDEAKAFFDEVLEKYPKSNTARKAGYRLKNLK